MIFLKRSSLLKSKKIANIYNKGNKRMIKYRQVYSKNKYQNKNTKQSVILFFNYLFSWGVFLYLFQNGDHLEDITVYQAKEILNFFEDNVAF